MIHNNFFLGHGKFWSDGQVMVAAADGDGVYLSIDWGGTWNAIDLGIVIEAGDMFAGLSIEYNYDAANFVVTALINGRGIARYYHYQGSNYQTSFYASTMVFNRFRKTENLDVGLSILRGLYTFRPRNVNISLANHFDFDYRVLDCSGVSGQEMVLCEGGLFKGYMAINNSYVPVPMPSNSNYWLITSGGGRTWLVGSNVVAKSIDDGGTWSYSGVAASLGSLNGEKYNIAGHGFQQLMMLATNGKVYRCQPDIYSPAADNWMDCNLPAGDYQWVDVAENNIAVTAKYGGKILVTSNNGLSWAEKENNRNWSRVAVAYTGTKRY